MHNYNDYFNLNDHPLLLSNILIKNIRESTLFTNKSSRKKLSVDFSSYPPRLTNPKFSEKSLETPRIKKAKSIEKPSFGIRTLSRNKEKSSAEKSSNFLKGFLTIEQKRQNLIDIINRKWDKSLEDCMKINYLEKFLEIINDRKTNSNEILQELDKSLSKSLEKTGDLNILDSLRLVFAEQSQIMRFYEEFLRKDLAFPLKTEQNPGASDKSRSNFEDLLELLRILLKLFLKKFTDLTIFLENKEEPLWINRLNSLKMKFRLQKNTGEIVKNIEDFESLFNELLNKVSELSNEKSQLSEELGALKKTIEKSFLFSKSETRDILMKPQKEADFSKNSLEFLNKYENMYKKSQEELKVKNEELSEEVVKLKRILDEKQEILNEKYKRRKLLRNSQENMKEDKEIQINLGMILENPRKTPLLHAETNPLAKYLSLSLNAYKLEEFYVKSLINLMLSDKIFDDYQEFLEKSPIKPFKNYIFEWLLMRFGNQTYAETLMKDFLGSILSAINDNERFLLISRFCGINLDAFNSKIKQKAENSEEFLVNFDENQEKAANCNEILSSFYCSPQAISVYLKLAYQFKHQEKDFDIYSPLLPDWSEEQSLIPYENADRLLKSLLEEELNDEHLAFEIANNFNFLVCSEKLPKMTKKTNLIMGNLGPKRNSLVTKRFGSVDMSNTPFLTPNTMLKGKANDVLIPFDILAKFLIDNLAKTFAVKMEVIITSLKLCQANRRVNDFFLEDFMTVVGKQFSNKSNKWLMTSFADFIVVNKSHEISGIFTMMFNHLENLMKNEVSEKFYLENYDKKEKKLDDKDESPPINNNNNETFSSGSARSLKKKKTSTFMNIKKNAPEEKEQVKLIRERNYSYVDSIIVILHTYHLLRESIRKEEFGNEVLEVSHEIFKKEIMKFPQNLNLVKNNYWNKFVGYDRNELIMRIETCWKTLRLMIDCIYSRGEKKDNK